MIHKIQIQNFQSHKRSSLELSAGVNIIVGASDSGKTAIIRALRWLLWNRPGGDSFRSHWGGDTSVTIDTSDYEISRSKGKENLYTLGNTEFKAFGTDVPEEIQQALNLNEINLQQQLDSPFLLTSSAGEVAAHFNRIAHLEDIGKGLKTAQSKIRELTQEIESDKKRVKLLREDTIQYNNLNYI